MAERSSVSAAEPEQPTVERAAVRLKRVALTGATGTLGTAVVAQRGTRRRGRGLSRDASGGEAGRREAWRTEPKGEPPPLDALRGPTASCTCWARPVAQRWSDEAKREIRDSRVLATRNLVAAIGELPEGAPPCARLPVGDRLLWAARRRARSTRRARGRRLPGTGRPRLGGRGDAGRAARRARRDAPAPAWCSRGAGRAREDAAVLQARRRRAGGRRAAVRAVGAHRRRGRRDASTASTTSGERVP